MGKLIALGEFSTHNGTNHIAWEGSVAVYRKAYSFCGPAQNTASPDQHFHPPSDAGEGNLDTPSITGLVPA
ncbi:unnamed protein product [Schistocephalus solidus]|uniref:DUF1996 domain-containing protein n=1 Tax=Schistocephalus solidus TaxID=70667 RepID=A0A183S901_SCHSO|nr:unnamed protein product [Schistocephalus solidus]